MVGPFQSVRTLKFGTPGRAPRPKMMITEICVLVESSRVVGELPPAPGTASLRARACNATARDTELPHVSEIDRLQFASSGFIFRHFRGQLCSGSVVRNRQPNIRARWRMG